MKLTQQKRISIIKRKCDQLVFNMFRKLNKQRFEPKFESPTLNFRYKFKRKDEKDLKFSKKVILLSKKINKKIKKRSVIISMKKIAIKSLPSY